ncbi:MAG: PIG-L family deacetylase [Chloroflexota bacterium]
MIHNYLHRNSDYPSILAVFAHPDDEAFLVGGTLAHYARCGARVELLCLTHGEGGASAIGLQRPDQLARLRRTELEECCKVLGVDLISVLNFPDGRLTDIGTNTVARSIAHVIEARQPEVVLTFGPDGLTGHPDHLAASQQTTLAFEQVARPGSALFYAGLNGQTVQRLSSRMEGSLGDLPLRLTGLPETRLPVKVDIHRTARLKWSALECHRSQADSFSGLSHSDRLLMSQYEYFQLARIAGGLKNRQPLLDTRSGRIK